jgi:hypothetical protein
LELTHYRDAGDRSGEDGRTGDEGNARCQQDANCYNKRYDDERRIARHFFLPYK